jgi:hypothetical protein
MGSLLRNTVYPKIDRSSLCLLWCSLNPHEISRVSFGHSTVQSTSSWCCRRIERERERESPGRNPDREIEATRAAAKLGFFSAADNHWYALRLIPCQSVPSRMDPSIVSSSRYYMTISQPDCFSLFIPLYLESTPPVPESLN